MGIRTTHTGSLPRPAGLTGLLIALEEGGPTPGLEDASREAIAVSVASQAAAGIDLLNDGEQGKTGYSVYVRDRLGGFGGPPGVRPQTNDLVGHEDFVALSKVLRGRPSAATPACDGPIVPLNPDAVHVDIANLKAAADSAGVSHDRLFLSAASPGVVAMFFENQYYPSREDYLAAIVDAMRAEYAAIVNAGILLQLDCPNFAMSHNSVFQDLSIAEFREQVALDIEALNAAVEGLPPERMRVHVCWGNYESPHTTDVPLGDLIRLIETVRPAGISIEGANPRHGHEWEVFSEHKLAEDHYLVPGVIDTTTNFVEHPRLVAQRIRNYMNVVGADRVVASTDCGFQTFIGRDRIAPSICWAKLASLAEGARLASA